MARASGVRRFLLIVGIIVLAAVIAVVGWGTWRIYHVQADIRDAAGRLPHELAMARAEGLPLEPAELRRHPPLTADRNAAPIFREMVAMSRELEGQRPGSTRTYEDAADGLRRWGRTEADRQAARQYVQRWEPYLRLAERAAAMPDCDFQRRYEEGLDMKFPEYAAARQAARVLAMRAVLRSDDGDVDGAFRDIAAGFALGRHTGRDPLLIAMLVQIAVETIMDRAFIQVLVDHLDDRRALVKARENLGACGAMPSLEYTLAGEAVVERVAVQTTSPLAALSYRESQERADRADWLVARRQGARLARGAFESRFVAYWRSVFRQLRAHRNDMDAARRATQGLYADIERRAKNGEMSYLLVAIIAPTVAEAVDHLIQLDALRRIRLCTLLLIEYRQRTGRFPSTLADMGRPPVLDPFTQQPLRYRRTSKGFVLYSVGKNRVDDGGVRKRKPNDTLLDIVVEYPY